MYVAYLHAHAHTLSLAWKGDVRKLILSSFSLPVFPCSHRHLVEAVLAVNHKAQSALYALLRSFCINTKPLRTQLGSKGSKFQGQILNEKICSVAETYTSKSLLVDAGKLYLGITEPPRLFKKKRKYTFHVYGLGPYSCGGQESAENI